nr:SAM-dependent methyltransferase [Paracoccus sp. FO-3]
MAERLAARMALATRVIPGITAIQALCAAHAVPLNRIGAPVQRSPPAASCATMAGPRAPIRWW